MTFQNREMLMKKSLMLSEVSGLNEQKNDGNFDSNRGDGAIRSLVMFGGSQLIGRGGAQEPQLPGSMIVKQKKLSSDSGGSDSQVSVDFFVKKEEQKLS